MTDLFNRYGNKPSGTLGNAMNMMKQFSQFKNSLTGNPEDMVMDMANKGIITNDKFSQVMNTMNMFRQFFK